MNILKEKTIILTNCGTVAITVNGKTEMATNLKKLIPVDKQKKISRKDFLGDKFTFYSLSDEEWKEVKFSEITESKVLTHCDQKIEPISVKEWRLQS